MAERESDDARDPMSAAQRDRKASGDRSDVPSDSPDASEPEEHEREPGDDPFGDDENEP